MRYRVGANIVVSHSKSIEHAVGSKSKDLDSLGNNPCWIQEVSGTRT